MGNSHGFMRVKFPDACSLTVWLRPTLLPAVQVTTPCVAKTTTYSDETL
jgi:hypothetical protein